MKLKVCGLTKEDHVRYCVQNKVEFCGFIFAKLIIAKNIKKTIKKPLIIWNTGRTNFSETL